jgi:hypothetical protein
MKMTSGLLFLTIFAGAACVGASAQGIRSLDHDFLEGIETPACTACIDTCAKIREQCKNLACTNAGGTNKGAQCDTGGNPANQQRFESELKACKDQEWRCSRGCSVRECK